MQATKRQAPARPPLEETIARVIAREALRKAKEAKEKR